MPRPFDLSRLATVQLVPPTPFTPDGTRVVPEVLARLVKEMVVAGVTVFIPAAGTGEFHSLTAAEAVGCIRVTREAAGPDCVVLAPVGLALAHAVEVGQQAPRPGPTRCYSCPRSTLTSAMPGSATTSGPSPTPCRYHFSPTSAARCRATGYCCNWPKREGSSG